MSTKKPISSFSVIIPVYNEEACLDELISRCLAACEKTGKTFEIIMIDDGSKDRSAEIITAAAAKYPNKIVGCILNRNYGQHAAIIWQYPSMPTCRIRRKKFRAWSNTPTRAAMTSSAPFAPTARTACSAKPHHMWSTKSRRRLPASR